MRLSIEIPEELEKKLIEKAESLKLSPEELVLKLLEGFLGKKRGEGSSEIKEFIAIAKEIANEKAAYCKFSDGTHCALEAIEDIFSETEPRRISKYRCLFCTYYADRRKEKVKKEIGDMKIHEIAKLSAKYLFEIYGDKLTEKLLYKPKKEVRSEKIERLLDW
ncbi:MAG: hypothetical protein QXN34_00600 [Archaeoglobaceae archaeon]